MRMAILMLVLAIGAAACGATRPRPRVAAPDRWLASGGKRDEHGKKQGVWARVDENGSKLYQGPFRSDVMHGTWTFWFEDGSELRVVYRNGRRVGFVNQVDLAAADARQEARSP